MAITNSERVGNAMNLLQKGLFPFVEREFKSVYKEQARNQAMAFLGDDRLLADKPMSQWDVAALLTQPTVTKLTEDRAEQFKRDPDKVASELENRLRDDLRQSGDFSRIHPVPRSRNDVPDDLDARLVVLSAETPHSKEPSNSLVFLAVDKTRLTDLDDALRRFLAWESIVNEQGTQKYCCLCFQV